MRTTDRGIALIKEHEGFGATAYLCPAGKKTIGYGHVILPGESFKEPMSKLDGPTLLQKDLRRFEAAVGRLVTVDLSQEQFDALVSLTFNIGEENLRTSTLLKRLNEGKYRDAAAQFTRWVYSKKKKLPGLVKRRAAEKALFLEGTAPEPVKPLAKSRTMVGASTLMATGGTALGVGVADQIAQVAPAVTVAREVAETAHNYPSGLFIVIGLLVIAAAVYIGWARWDDHQKGLR